ncbi:sensor histidine kinase [Sulfitobacter aestuariivivens]|uniref:histidine kinase n=1 Tax=Sulfitobacter aestuariivivens TaxID=2766981 RepID=A0A927D5S5_9RHOB|nr:HAMP domain-containing sensor histidine kinase [Sulfitobacter aestuariivivens]MBD3664349.1 HAMP domain-containing histidine kinase [Sulfitobacter aestuariivivens]
MIRPSVDLDKTTAPQPEPAEGNVAEQASSDIDDFIYLISHDVRASVRALLELPQWIAEDLEVAGIKVDGTLATSIELMNRHTGRLDRMLVDLLAFSRVGRLQATQELDLRAAVEEVLEEMRIPAGFHVRHDLAGLTVMIGNRDLPTLLSALISNGIKHHHADTGNITVSAQAKGDQVVIRVCDDGPGVEERFNKRIFAPMTTLRPRDEVEGSGMGLATVRKIATHYGGSARLLAAPHGKGTCVEVRLPAARQY